MTREQVAKTLADLCFDTEVLRPMAATIFVEAALFQGKEVQYTKEMLEVAIYDYLQDKGIYKEEK